MEMLHDNVLIKPERLEKTESGIILPPTDDNAIIRGTVTEVGRYVYVVNRNSMVLFNRISAMKINIDGEELYVVKDKDIIAKL